MGKDSSEDIIQRYLTSSPFNTSEGDPKFIACVGWNGGYDQTTIYDGFVDAVKTLFESVNQDKKLADPIVYPMLFCFRHSIELFLKKLYSSLQYIEALKERPSEARRFFRLQRKYHRIKRQSCELNTLKNNRAKSIEMSINSLEKKLFSIPFQDEHTHDLNSLISKIRKIYHVAPGIKELFDDVSQVLKHYGNLDPRGDFFRYWFDTTGNPNFENQDISTVRLDIIYVHFCAVTMAFEKIEWDIWRTCKEYGTGTFTEELSRSQIEEISKLLPKKEKFNDEIKGVKEKIKREYGLSSRKFDRVLKMIRRHREFSANMGVEKPFSYLSDETIRILVKSSFGLCKWKVGYSSISRAELILIVTFATLGGWQLEDACYSEALPRLYYQNRQRYGPYININPSKMIKFVIKGMEKCGQVTYINKMRKHIERCNRIMHERKKWKLFRRSHPTHRILQSFGHSWKRKYHRFGIRPKRIGYWLKLK